MFGLIYAENGKPKTHKKKFESNEDVEKIAKQMGLEDFSIIPLSAKPIDLYNF